MSETPPPARRSYYTLDGLKGLTALIVATRHVPIFFRGLHTPETFLAVDLFYLLSGFVVAHAYNERLRAGGFIAAFLKTRLIRLYPFYLLGLAISVIPAGYAAITDPAGWWNASKLAEAILTGLFLVPLLPGMHANGGSLDGPTWTLLPELAANLVYAIALPFLRTWVMALITLGFAGALIYAEFHFGSLDLGYGVPDQWAGMVRAGFSFFAGALLFRYFANRKTISNTASWLCVALLALALCFPPPDDLKPYYELAVVLIGFPVLIAMAACVEPGARSARLFAFAGAASYGVYILHQPLGGLLRIALHNKPPPFEIGLVCGGIFLISLFPLARWIEVHYDAPVRRMLQRWFLQRKPVAA